MLHHLSCRKALRGQRRKPWSGCRCCSLFLYLLVGKAATKWSSLSFFFFLLPPNTAIYFSFKEEFLAHLTGKSKCFHFLAYFLQFYMLKVSHIKVDNSSIFLKSVLKLYFKHFYLKLSNSCLYEKEICPGILKCMSYGVVR